VRAARALDDRADAAALRAILEALSVAGMGKAVGRILPRIAAGLSRQELSFFRSFASSRSEAQIAGVPDPEQAARELDLALAPEFSIAAFLREAEEGEDEGFDLPFPELGDDLGGALDILEHQIASLPPATQRELEARLREGARSGGLQALKAIVDILKASGVGPVDVPPQRSRRR
jgi:hypothetical protein